MQVVDRHNGMMAVKTQSGVFFVIPEPKMPPKRNALGHFKSERKAPKPTLDMLVGHKYVLTLTEARKLLGKDIAHPTKLTKPASEYVCDPHRKGN